MRRTYSETPETITAEMRKRFTSPDPEIQERKKISISEAIGNAELHFHRGHNSGVFDSYLTLKKDFPEAGQALLKAYSMRDEDGEWVIS